MEAVQNKLQIMYSIKKTLFLKVIVIIFLFRSHNVFSQTTYNITNPEALENQSYVPGDEIILANGTYNTDSRLDFIGNGTADNPITFRAETPGGVIFTGGLQVDIGGDFVVVEGFHWKGGYGASNFIQFRNGTDYANHSKIQNCAIDGLAIHPDDLADDTINNSITKHRWIVLYGTYNTVTNCSFMNKSSAGALILAEYSYNAQEDPCATVGHKISNNYFYNYEKIDNTLSNSGDSETIRIGASSNQNVHSNITVNNNYFVEADGENEIITNKSKGNVFTKNTFRRCRGSLVLRHGSESMVDQNYFLGENVDGTGGIRISDSDHTITNNYIQECITVGSQAKWNNGITFIGGGDNAAVACTSINTTNGYQKSENITLSNNTFINTNAPLYYNTDKGSNDPTGTVSNNLIYFTPSNPNLSNVISGNTASSYTNMGTTLAYTGNVYNGATLGETNAGFSEETGITAAAAGEIFTISGTGSAGKGADMGSYLPATDANVGYGIGACFLDNSGANITNGNCNIVISESLTIGSLPTLASVESSNNVSVIANVSWTAVANDAWISIDIDSGDGNATVSVSVTENTDSNSRTGSVTFTQDSGGDDIERTLTVTQEGADLTSLYSLINDVSGGEPVSIHSYSQQEVEGTKTNYASNTLDKDMFTRWAAQDGAILSGDYKGDGEYIIYDLGEEYELNLIQIATDNKTDPYGLQIWVSTTGIVSSDFTKVLPTTGDLVITTTSGTYEDFDQYEITVNARYVKLVGFGRFNAAGDTRASAWNNITEIEFFGTSTLSIDDNQKHKLTLYPNPAKQSILIENTYNTIISIHIYSIQGKKVLEKAFPKPVAKVKMDVSSLTDGVYMVSLIDDNGSQTSKKLLVLNQSM